MVSDSSLSSFIASNPDARELKRGVSGSDDAFGPQTRGDSSDSRGGSRASSVRGRSAIFPRGVECFRLAYKGSQSYLSADQRGQINAWLSTQSQPSVASLASYIQTQFGVVFSLIAKLLRPAFSGRL